MADRFTVRAVVLFLGAFVLLCMGGIIWLLATGTPVTDLDPVSLPMGVALGSLGTLLASTKAGPTEDEWRQLAAVTSGDGDVPTPTVS